MKVLQLGKFYPVKGGVEKVMLSLTEGLSARGIDCDMLCAGDCGTVRLNGHGRVICMKSMMKLAATEMSPAMVSWLRKHCDEYDIIHIHHPDPMAAVALKGSGFKGRVILHWHSDIVKQRFLLKLYKPIQNWLIERADLIVGTTPVYVEQSPWLDGVQGKVCHVPIGIKPMEEACEQSVADLRQDGRKIVFALGRLVEYKGFEYLVEAASYLPDEFRVVIAGQGPLEGKLQEQIGRLGLDGKVMLAGYVLDEQVCAWMRASDVFCVSSVQKSEAFCIAQVEAMSCGCPVVATTIPGSGVSWVNEDGVSGRNVGIRDAKALAEAIEDVAANREKYSNGAKKRYEDVFTYDKMLDNIINKYTQ